MPPVHVRTTTEDGEKVETNNRYDEIFPQGGGVSIPK
jgi:hypothetical protein